MSHGKRYIDIGHGDPDAILWMFDRVEHVIQASKAGSGRTHEKIWGWDCIKCWRGRYDHKTGEISIVVPEHWNQYHGVPEWIIDALESKFGGTLIPYVFNPVEDLRL